jgi:hypothetical protein
LSSFLQLLTFVTSAHHVLANWRLLIFFKHYDEPGKSACPLQHYNSYTLLLCLILEWFISPVENQGMHRPTVQLGQAQPTAGMKILIRYLPVLVNMCTCMCDICQWLILLFSRRNFALPNYSWESWNASSHSSIGPSSSNTRYLHIEATKYKKKN